MSSEVKNHAKQLSSILKDFGYEIKHSHAIEAISRMSGFQSWNHVPKEKSISITDVVTPPYGYRFAVEIEAFDFEVASSAMDRFSEVEGDLMKRLVAEKKIDPIIVAFSLIDAHLQMIYRGFEAIDSNGFSVNYELISRCIESRLKVILKEAENS